MTACFLSRLLFGQTWLPAGAPTNYWASVACSADGVKIVVAAGGQSSLGAIYTSTNSGQNWLLSSASSNNWISVASSADGSRFLAAAYNGGLYTSTNFGATWQTNPVANHIWQTVASSADGSRLFATYYNSLVFISTNGGAGWFSNSTALPDVRTITASAAGNKVFAGNNTGHTLASTNSGTTWAARTALINNIYSLAGSADGNRLIAAAFDGSGPYVSTSTNAGVNWVSNNLPVRSDWFWCASSADGSRLAAVGGKGVIYTSVNSGQNWVSNDVPQLLWTGIASSADGNVLVAISQNQGIWIRRQAVLPAVNLTPSGNGLKLSWPVASTNVVVQQSSDLRSWGGTPVQPVLNCTNLQNEVILSNASGSIFYRLKTP
ncbi:MAG: hypothetical protein P4N60_12150 [Verrucomicrobiae bacterium]|nr:hypothetical protein [Verrucomicrobiae bacterium]